MNQTPPDQANPNAHPALIHAMRTLPAWKMKLLGFGLAIGCVGAGTQVASYFLNGPSQPAPQTAPSTSSQQNAVPANGFVTNSSANNAPASPSTSPPAAPSPTGLLGALSPFMSHFGFSLFVGIVFGVIFRTFLKTALIISAFVVAAAYAVTHVLHVNIDMTAVKSDTSQAVSWLTDQGYRLRTMVFHVLPSSTAAMIGFFVGFKRR